MTPHSVLLGDVRPGHVETLKAVRQVVRSLPDGLDCHQVCAAVASALPPGTVGHVRGHFSNKGYPHSWLVIPGAAVIIDAYPWAGHEPFLVCTAGLSPWRFLYVPRPVQACSS
jgi:hypothetical protein